jgi:hypothetical protein
MTIGGWITMILSVGFVTGLFAWCIYRVLKGPEHPGGYAHVEPIEEDQADER